MTTAQVWITNAGEEEKKKGNGGKKILNNKNNPKMCCAQHPAEISKNSLCEVILISLLTSKRVRQQRERAGIILGLGLWRGTAGRDTIPGHDPEQEEVWTEASPHVVGIGRALRFETTPTGCLPRPGCRANHERAKGRDGKRTGAQPGLRQGEPRGAAGGRRAVSGAAGE